jgi:hypothetical protein
MANSFKVALAALALVTFGACASDDDAATEETTAPAPAEPEDGGGGGGGDGGGGGGEEEGGGDGDGGGGGEEGGGGESDPFDDVTITDCRTFTPEDEPVADLSITNNSSERSDYTVGVAFESSNQVQIPTTFVEADGVLPGEVVIVSALPNVGFVNKVECRIDSVSRTASS